MTHRRNSSARGVAIVRYNIRIYEINSVASDNIVAGRLEKHQLGAADSSTCFLDK